MFPPHVLGKGVSVELGICETLIPRPFRTDIVFAHADILSSMEPASAPSSSSSSSPSSSDGAGKGAWTPWLEASLAELQAKDLLRAQRAVIAVRSSTKVRVNAGIEGEMDGNGVLRMQLRLPDCTGTCLSRLHGGLGAGPSLSRDSPAGQPACASEPLQPERLPGPGRAPRDLRDGG
jgi:hypothetical protein